MWNVRAVGIGIIFLLSSAEFAAAADAPAVVVVENCSVFDSATGEMHDGRTILIRGERIESVGAAGEQSDVPADARRIDGRGKFAIPGLIDAHVHVVHILDYAQVTGEEVLPL